MKAGNIIKIVSFTLAMFIAGCVSIPSEAPELSIELGKRISAIEESNITLIHRYFDHKREQVDNFIQEEWIPEFAKNFFSNSKVRVFLAISDKYYIKCKPLSVAVECKQ